MKYHPHSILAAALVAAGCARPLRFNSLAFLPNGTVLGFQRVMEKDRRHPGRASAMTAGTAIFLMARML